MRSMVVIGTGIMWELKFDCPGQLESIIEGLETVTVDWIVEGCRY